MVRNVNSKPDGLAGVLLEHNKELLAQIIGVTNDARTAEAEADRLKAESVAQKRDLASEKDRSARCEANLLETRLQLAELRGYLKAIRDGEPPRMVPDYKSNFFDDLVEHHRFDHDRPF